MKFCTQCGNKSEDSNKFCQECGASLSENFGNSNTTSQRFLSPNEKKEKLLNLGWVLFCLTLFDEVLVREFSAIPNETGVVEYLVYSLLWYVFLYFGIKVQGIDKDKPGWILATFIIWFSLTIFVYSIAEFSKFNWADWTTTFTTLPEVVIFILMWLKAKTVI
jgi:hypothetical protein